MFDRSRFTSRCCRYKFWLVPEGMIRSQKKQAMEDLGSFSAGDLTLRAGSPVAFDRGMESTREGGGLLDLNATNLLAVGSQDVLKVLVVGDEAVGAEQ